jgi:glutamyl-tRNA reductase
MKMILLGMNHESAPIEVRERLAVDEPGPLLQKLVDSDDIEEAVLFSTCNRVEVLVLTRSLESTRHRLHAFFGRDLASDDHFADFDFDAVTYEYRDGDAVSHVLRVASALDSMVVGEPQILGQTKDAYWSAARADRFSDVCFSTPSRPPSGFGPRRASASARFRWLASRWISRSRSSSVSTKNARC